jgi:hypothetical protein
MIFKKVIPILILLVAIIFQKASSQSYVAFSSGFSIDLNNKKTFYHLPVILRMKPFKKSGFFIEGNYGILFSRQGAADAYTTNPALPEHVVLTETVLPHLFTISLGGEIHLYTNKKSKNSIYLDIAAGVSSQHFRVNYKNYDKLNYEVLNPDLSTDSSGLVLSIAGVYNFHKQNMFLMLHVQTPPLISATRSYTMTYELIAPLELTFGYKLLNKRK